MFSNFFLHIDVIPQARPRFVKGIVIDSPKSKKFKEDFATLIKLEMTDPMYHGAIKVNIDIYRNFPKPTSKKYGDIDNLAKGILDACNGILWKDDSQIVSLNVEKFITDSEPNIKLVVQEWQR